MVEDVPSAPYWQYLPRNLSYTSEPDSRCIRGPPTHSKQLKDRCINKMSLQSSDEEATINELEGELGSLNELESTTPEIDGVVDIFGDLDVKEDKTGFSDYGSDLSTSSSVDTFKIPGSNNADITVIVSSDDPDSEDSGTESKVKCKTGNNHIAKKENNTCSKDGGKLSLFIPNIASNHGDLAKSFLDLLDSGEDDDFLAVGKGELRRSTSLKTNKTPPNTPQRKKAVRFADAFGLDLENVRHILNLDDPPKIPPSAMADLKKGIESEQVPEGSLYFQAQFAQPGANGNFIQRVHAHKVSLENAMINNLTITGTVRVANISYHKQVRIRYTTNNWTTFSDILGSYVQNSCDGATDRFSFTLVAPSDLVTGNKLAFAVGFDSDGQSYWDNNFGQNYVFECFAKTVPTLNSESTWVHFL
ncbi:uncharacterized protein LOC141901691 [Tubulanus polymorphus]|uniref:uncharacterized protein LOC141901691 n=1 Tax=Tubulanus polymorphus TaxID=672921 RepID=UPI003DA2B70D